MVNIFWFRRDLRLDDNVGLFHLLKDKKNILPIFIFDPNILSHLPRYDRRVDFIHQALSFLNEELMKVGGSLKIIHASPEDAYKNLLKEFDIEAVYTNHDYEPYAIQRDESISRFLASKNIEFKSFKDQVIFEKDEVLKQDGKPYTVYTPYSNAWKKKLLPEHLKENDTKQCISQDSFFSEQKFTFPTLSEIGFQKTDLTFNKPVAQEELIKNYHLNRNIPSLDATTRLSIHLRFGTVSIRKLVKKAMGLNETWLSELIWREFFMQILYHFPHSASSSFKSKYDRIEWRNNEKEFEAWCNGKTGYPIVDAGMRELNATGFMHNRVRMIVASFLTKHLLIDWRWGERYFAEKLLDYECSSNIGNWQWAAGSGCDAAPYFRIFNPYEQTKKFDPELKYIHKWVPELNSFEYPSPIVDHTDARNRALRVYKSALEGY